MRLSLRVILVIAPVVILPELSYSQTGINNIHALHAVLDQLYEDMLPLCSKLISVGRGLAGFAATWYIASRVWRHLANAEPIDFYPLFRPFVIGFAVMIFPSVLALINGVMKPTVTATAAMVSNSDKAIAILLKQKEDAIKNSNLWKMYVGESGLGDREKWLKYTHSSDSDIQESMIESLGNDMKFAMAKTYYSFRNSIKAWMSEVLGLLFQAASLSINTIRTFYLIVLAILGPLAFGIAVFDGFQHTLTVWLARYLNVFLWLPVANLFGSVIEKIQEKMLVLDLSQVQENGDTFFSSTDTAYLIFMVIGIIGYFTVPSISNYIVHAGGGNSLLYKVSNVFSSATHLAAHDSKYSNTHSQSNNSGQSGNHGTRSSAVNAGYFNGERGIRSGNNYMEDKISGK